MPSKSTTTDKTDNTTRTAITDRRVVQERGNQILDSIVQTTDDKVVRAALAEVRSMLANMNGTSTITVTKMEQAMDKVLRFVNKGQVDISNFGLKALETARAELRNVSDQGLSIIELANMTVGDTLKIAKSVVDSQATNQNIALEILADTKSGDYADVTKSVVASMMIFILGALYILKKG